MHLRGNQFISQSMAEFNKVHYPPFLLVSVGPLISYHYFTDQTSGQTGRMMWSNALTACIASPCQSKHHMDRAVALAMFFTTYSVTPFCCLTSGSKPRVLNCGAFRSKSQFKFDVSVHNWHSFWARSQDIPIKIMSTCNGNWKMF